MIEEIKDVFPYKKLGLNERVRWKRAWQYDLFTPPLSHKEGIDICIAENFSNHQPICIRAYSKKDCAKRIDEETIRAKEAYKFDFFMQYSSNSIVTRSSEYFITELCNCGSLSAYTGAKVHPEVIREVASFPVSYTHLTLPTICSV
eukprot:TRINITY_DN21342_c0_g1_i1.p1 TRINITY_DN21342_c0_g1~~TRINITY_DN21342_c0_g1_i1.p1  ORF type:complete len:146 (+),score=28.67 TRINITY_DN21342_c0_g1_i1:130-567(+)